VEVSIDYGSIATTGNSERGIVVDGALCSHVIDPRTGRPVRDFGSVTVWADDATSADALSTGLYVMGPRAALEWAHAHAGVEVVLILNASGADGSSLQVVATDGWRNRLTALTPRATIHFGSLPTTR
jgi:thiamine biosynthesis lipoprotein